MLYELYSAYVCFATLRALFTFGGDGGLDDVIYARPRTLCPVSQYSSRRDCGKTEPWYYPLIITIINPRDKRDVRASWLLKYICILLKVHIYLAQKLTRQETINYFIYWWLLYILLYNACDICYSNQINVLQLALNILLRA